MRLTAEAAAVSAARVSPPVARALDVLARRVAEVGRADDEDLEALRPGLVAAPRTGRDAHRVPLLELDDLVVELHPPAAAHDDVDLLLLVVRMAVREAVAGRDALVAQAGLLELERLGRQPELEVRRTVEPGADVLQVLLEVPVREGHGAILRNACADHAERVMPGTSPARKLAGMSLPEPSRPAVEREVTRLDVAVYAAIAATPTPTLDRSFAAVSRAADDSKLWIATAAVLALTGGREGRRAALDGLASVALTSMIVNVGVKPLQRRRRP